MLPTPVATVTCHQHQLHQSHATNTSTPVTCHQHQLHQSHATNTFTCVSYTHEITTATLFVLPICSGSKFTNASTYAHNGALGTLYHYTNSFYCTVNNQEDAGVSYKRTYADILNCENSVDAPMFTSCTYILYMLLSYISVATCICVSSNISVGFLYMSVAISGLCNLVYTLHYTATVTR